MQPTYVLGLSALYHDSAAALLRNGKVVAAAQEERFSRHKHDSSFPNQAIRFCLDSEGIETGDINAAVFYEKPLLHLDRLVETHLAGAPKGFNAFRLGLNSWLSGKLGVEKTIRKALQKSKAPIFFTEHHEAHQASAFFPSPFPDAAILTVDAVGEWATTSIAHGDGATITPIAEIEFPHSLGLLYSAFTYYLGFTVNSGEYKVMGLAPYGEPKYVQQILDEVIDLRSDGSFRLNLDHFNYCTGLTMTSPSWDQVFGGPPRRPESDLTQRDMDLAASIQEVTNVAMLGLANQAHELSGSSNLCLSGGVALNCVANSEILRQSNFKSLWIQPAAGDAGSALGAALSVWHRHFDEKRDADGLHDQQQGSLLGPEFSDSAIKDYLDRIGSPYHHLSEPDLLAATAVILADGGIVGWFQGRMEFGPRALGNRSILGDPRQPEMQRVMNQKIKFRESFRPFAPSVLEERASEYFELDGPSPYMLLTAPVTADRRRNSDGIAEGLDRLRLDRSEVPAVTHVDYSARLQTVSRVTNPKYHALITEFDRLTGCPLVVNTSFNVRGEPIVCSPEDAYRCFMSTEIDALVLGNFIIRKEMGAPTSQDVNWEIARVLD